MTRPNYKAYTTEELRTMVTGLENLKDKYESERPFTNCPLCTACRCKCGKCPWKLFTNGSCAVRIGEISLAKLKYLPKTYPMEAKMRIDQINNWIKRLNIVITLRREDNNNTKSKGE